MRYDVKDKSTTRFRGSLAKGFDTEDAQVSLTGGAFDSGFIRGFAVVTRGEALGHELFLDREFVRGVGQALELAEPTGIKSHYTHPDMSANGLAKGLGRVALSEGSPDVIRGDLNFWHSSRRSPDGDLALHVITRAEEDPESFGSSISFYRDFDAEQSFLEANGAVKKSDEFGEYWDLENFISPDPENVNNYPHARLGRLLAVDIVDDPAANPAGLFSTGRDSVFDEASELLEFALGLGDKVPKLSSLDIDPERVTSFVTKFLITRGLKVMRLNTRKDKTIDEVFSEAVVEDEVEVVTDPVVDEVIDEEITDETPAPEASTETDSEDPPQQEEGLEALSRYVEAFGAENGSKWLIEKVSFAEAQQRHAAVQAEQIVKLQKQLAQARKSEAAPVSDGSAQTGKSGFAGLIRFRGAAAASNN